VSVHEAIADFISFMEAAGVKPVEPIAQRLGSGNLIRFRCEGDGKGRHNGWAILYLDDRPAGAFGNYKANTGTLKWKSGSDRPALSTAERQALQREWREKKEQREAEKRQAELEASLDARDMWQRAGPADSEHGYVTRKLLLTYGLKQDGSKLLVPMVDAEGTLWNLQRISPDGTKRFLEGGRIHDLFVIIGTIDQKTTELVIVEGYATGDAVHQASGLPAIVAFNTGNLPRVARLWAQARPDLNFTIFADDDEATAQESLARRGVYKNPGIEAAEAAAAEIGASVAYPLSWHERMKGAA